MIRHKGSNITAYFLAISLYLRTYSDIFRTRGRSVSYIMWYLVGGFLLTSMCWSNIDGKVVTSPENRVVMLGETIQFSCSTDERFSINWQHIPVRLKAVLDIYISRVIVSPYDGRFSVETKGLGGNVTEYNLIIRNVQKEDAGTFICIDYSGLGEKKEAQLTVIESPPRCSSNIEPSGFIGENDCGHPIETVKCSCSIKYSGNIAPTSQWVTSAGHMISAAPITNTTEHSVSSEISISASIMSSNGVSIIWQLVESAHINWISNPIRILYAKRNDSAVTVGFNESVICSARSSENCSYSWIARIPPNHESVTLQGQVLRVYKPGTYQCEAVCPLRRTSCSVTSLYAVYAVPPTTQSENGDRLMLGVFLGVLFAVIAIILVTLLARKRGKCFEKPKQCFEKFCVCLPVSVTFENEKSKNTPPASSSLSSPQQDAVDLLLLNGHRECGRS